MENEYRQASYEEYMGASPYSSPAPEDRGFHPSEREKIFSFAVWVLGYLYVRCVLEGSFHEWPTPVFTLLFVAAGEWMFRGKERRPESSFWMGCLLCCGFAGVLPWSHRVWDWSMMWLFLHCFAVYWVLSRAGCLYEGKTGHLLPLDALNGFLLLPFGNFFLRLQTAFHTLTEARKGRSSREKKGGGTFFWILAAVCVSLALLKGALSLLSDADAAFGEIMTDLEAFFTMDFEDVFLFDLFDILVALPVSAYLYGLIAGAWRTKSQEALEKGRGIVVGLEKLRKVPAVLWTVILCVFSAFYILFFFLQASYLFGAFTGRLPEGFLVSEYARQGFFELCRISALNFTLLWLATRVNRERTPLLKAVSLGFLAENLLFCGTAASKLGLYIVTFGFTPLRFQSFWLVAVLAAASVCWAVSLLGERKTFRGWAMFSAATACLLALY